MAWYKTGTATFTNGNTSVTGSGTDWIANAKYGEGIIGPDGKTYEISSITSSTSLTIGTPYLGATAPGASYSILPSQSYLRDLVAQAAALIATFVNSTQTQAGAAQVKATPVDADSIVLLDSANGGLLRKLSWAGIKSALASWMATSSLAFNGTIGAVAPAASAFTTVYTTGNIRCGSAIISWDSGISAIDIGYGGGLVAVATTTEIHSNNYFDGTNNRYKVTGTAAKYTVNAGTGIHSWSTAPSGTAGSVVTFTQAMTLDSSGNLLVGQTTGNSKVSATQSGSNNIFLATLGSGGAAFQATGTASTMTAGYFLTSSGVAGSISCSGTNTIYTTSSDHRLKLNQQPLTGSGAFIAALKPTTWNWAQDGSAGVGFIAHEFQAVSPGSVSGTKDETTLEQYEITPATDTEPAVMGERTVPKYQAMQASSAEVMANIIAELQSLHARLAALESA